MVLELQVMVLDGGRAAAMLKGLWRCIGIVATGLREQQREHNARLRLGPCYCSCAPAQQLSSRPDLWPCAVGWRCCADSLTRTPPNHAPRYMASDSCFKTDNALDSRV